MSITAADIAVDLTARYDKLDRQLATASSRVDRSLGAMEQRGSAFASRFTGLLAGVSAAALVGELSKLADVSKQLDAQLKLATAGFGTFAQAQADTRKIAADTRSSLEATTALYGNFARASQQTGRSQADAARATETFSKVLKIGGADANAAASATLQFGQALASGALRGDEFNSIAEASPRLVKLIADAMGVTQGEVRKLAEEGKITTDVLFRALNERKFTAAIDAEFKTLPTTFDQAMQQITNAAIITFGAFDNGGQFSNALVNLLTQGTDSFKGLEKLATDYGIEVRSVFGALSTVFDPLVSGATAAFGNITTQANYARDTIASLLSGIDQVRNIPIRLQNGADSFDNSAKRILNEAMRRAGNTGPGFALKPVQPLSDLSGGFQKAQQEQARQLRINSSAARLEARGFIVVRNADGTVNADATTANGGRRRALAAPIPKPSAPRSTPGSRRATARNAGGTAAAAVFGTQDLVSGLSKDLGALDSQFDRLFVNGRDNADRARAQFRDIFGTEGTDFASPFAGVEESNRTRAQDLAAREDVENQLQGVREQNVRSLANTYETLFQEGTSGVWRNFKDEGLRTLALIAAQATVASFSQGGGGFGSLFGNLVSGAGAAFGGGSSQALPRLANGGSIRAGGLGGVDRNVLSVNGIPRAMIGAHENLGVVNPNLSGINTNVRAASPVQQVTNHYAINVDAKNSVNPAGFAKQLSSVILTEAARMDGRTYGRAMQDTPGNLSSNGQLKS